MPEWSTNKRADEKSAAAATAESRFFHFLGGINSKRSPILQFNTVQILDSTSISSLVISLLQ